jgi:putative MATE family efflux protein
MALGIPALGALIAEPLFVALDSAMVGHLGAANLAGLSVASAILQTAVGLMVFLAYATTPLVARRLGAKNIRGAIQAGVDGLYLALGLGIALAVLLLVAHGWLIGLFDVTPATFGAAKRYLAISTAGLPAMLLVFAATGTLRGLQDTKTPLYVAVLGFGANAILNALLIYGAGLGIAGSALGTVIAQWGMVAVYVLVIHKHVRRHRASWMLHLDGLKNASVTGGWLFVRTAGLRAALLITVGAATLGGTDATAAYHVVFTLLTMLSFSLDALAIAAQALIGEALGAADSVRARAVMRRTLAWGTVMSAVLAVVLALLSPVIGYVFTTDPGVLAALPRALLVVALSLPLSGAVFVLDGVLMGAGDVRYLAWTSVVNLLMYAPAVLWVWATTAVHTTTEHVGWLTTAYAVVFMGARFFTLGLRGRSNRWVTLGENRQESNAQ